MGVLKLLTQQSNGTIYSNKASYGEPEDNYDTINEDEIDKYRNFTNWKRNDILQ